MKGGAGWREGKRERGREGGREGLGIVEDHRLPEALTLPVKEALLGGAGQSAAVQR
jgi:hypothetical protein